MPTQDEKPNARSELSGSQISTLPVYSSNSSSLHSWEWVRDSFSE